MVIALLLPVLILFGVVIAAAIILDSPGPILYRAPRIGRDGRHFEMLKFRKMREDASGPWLTSTHDPRFTPIGRFLAITRLDELPQIWNVIKGDMRLVGPRPEAAEFVRRYEHEYERILSILPGITGPAQLEHFGESLLFSDHEDPVDHYGEQILPRKIELDLGYVRSRSLPGDLGILLRTLALPFRLLGARLTAPFEQGRAGLLPQLVLVIAVVALMISFVLGAGSAR